ncbi:heavy metal translocating P-type ATPase [Actinospica sp. MGRD01-02]|uniref:Heavy metal translocating P-type ATPase n=1 Tax=Actinospica acidithermotolerans TaxID=2828514 RepID=A0A941E6W0_9ACTN|nr:heavy metal translocating P-type ATPase [Actinospica acidithermotolerans]MBR7825033.1 heavy metal translocating P-type ATPase [Actinospica acidithermotolerans]
MPADVLDLQATAVPAAGPAAPVRTRGAGVWTLPEVRWAALATALFLVGLIAHFTGAPAWLAWAFFLACYAAGGWEPGLAGLGALREKTLDVDLLMVLAAIGAAAVGQVLDGGLLIVIFATSGALEAAATHRTAQAVRGLLDLAPERAVRVAEDGAEEYVEAAALKVGDVVLVRPGERIAADGQVTAGASEVDQATITGEPLPVAKSEGDEVFAGTLNGTGALRVRVDREASESVVARIVAMVEEASETKAATQLFIEKVEQRYSIGMVTATLLLFAIPLLAGAAFQPSLLRAMTFMIVASPCAVVLATMPPLLASMANAGRHGVLVKSAVVMERFGTVTRVAFDKTGTLTEGTPRLAQIRVLAGSDLTEQQIVALAAAAENPSEHPLARAIVAAAREAGHTLVRAKHFAAIPGQGVRATVQRHQVEIGSPSSLHTTPNLELTAEIEDLEGTGHTAALVRVDGKPVAVFGIADRIRPATADTVTRITAVTGSEPLLVTGDNRRAAGLLAGQAGITEVRAELLPQDKVGAVRELEAAGQRVLLVGDGVNDAPALAAAHVGVAMGRAGSDLALDTADAVIMRDDLATVPAVITLSRRARGVVKANLVIASTIILGLVTWDLAGHLPLPLGVLGHEGSTVIVGLNGLRLLRKSAWTRALGAAVRR